MPRVCVVVVAGLDTQMLSMLGPRLGAIAHQASLESVFPAVTSTFQASLTTGRTVGQHGIICNGLYTRGEPETHALLDTDSYPEFRREVSFWEQSSELVKSPRFWADWNIKTSMLFFQQSIGQSADIILTPKPVHTPDGRTVSSCWSRPNHLYESLATELGPFPLHHYWGPMAGLPASVWIGKAAARVWDAQSPDLQWVYIPHLDYNLQRLGPGDPAIARDIRELDTILEPLISSVWKSEGKMLVVGDYAMSDVCGAVAPNLALRRAGLLKTRPDADGKLLVDHDASEAFVMVDHQVGFLYARPEALTGALGVLRELDGIQQIMTKEHFDRMGIDTPRTGGAVILAAADHWLMHDWWEQESEKPAWQFSVDIHRKPGYDPRELFFEGGRPGRAIAQDPVLVRGSHGLADSHSNRAPAICCDSYLFPRRYRLSELVGMIGRLLGRTS